MIASTVRWIVTVSRETDTVVRSYLAEHCGKKGNLSQFIERAVQKELLRATVHDVQERNARLDGSEVQVLIDDACATNRAEFWAGRR